MFWKVVRTHQVKEFVGDPRLAVQAIDVDRGEVFHAKGALNLVRDIVNDPRYIPIDGPFLSAIAFLFIVDVEVNT